jgi:archaellum biogenesis protein FlaJ (TadC family)
MWEWIAAHTGLILALSIAGFFATLIVMVVLIVRMPSDYFLHQREPPWKQSHPVLRIGLIVFRNLLGAALLLAGIVMLATPGQGVLSILLGISLLDVPGKRRLEMAIIRREPVHKSMDWIRKQAGRPPLKVPPKRHHDGT